MKLLTKAHLDRFAKLGRQDHPDAEVVVKFFTPWSNWTWYVTEYDPTTGICFGLVEGFETELGSFSLAELEAIRGPFGLKVERDRHFGRTTLSALKAKGVAA